jgi:BirA family biotin operon repressor/biotin-[acetyl-CoA-carboxylase] ligase
MTPSDATPHPGIFANSRAAAMANGWSFTHVSSTGSTNTDLAAAARAGSTGIELLVADHQSAGRGRLDRRWEDDRSGQLMFSFRTPVDDDLQVAPGAIAVAAHEAVTAAGVDAGIKWPNDLVVEHGDAPGKLAGLLSEYVASAPPCVVIGLGLNVTSAPVEGATSLAASGSTADRDDVLSMLLERLPELLGDIDLVRDELRRRSATLGRKVRVERSGGDLVGVAIDLTAGGGLVLSVDGSPVEVSVGDVIHLRPED